MLGLIKADAHNCDIVDSLRTVIESHSLGKT